MLEITLPLPPEVLHPNGRTRNHKYRAAMVKKTRGEAALLAKAAAPDPATLMIPWTKATIQATFYLPRKRDQDGLIAWLKSYADGLQDAGIILNDSGFTWLPPIQHTGKLAGRRVVLRITPI